MIRVLIINSLTNITTNNYNLVTCNNNSKKPYDDNYKAVENYDDVVKNNEQNYDLMKHRCSIYYVEDNSMSHNFDVNNRMREMSDLWQVAKKSPVCVAIARLMRLWGHQNYNFMNLGHDSIYLDHLEQDFNFPDSNLRLELMNPWYNFIKLLEVSEKFELDYGNHQFKPVSWLNYNGIESKYEAHPNNPTSFDWTKPMLWLNPERLTHTTGSGRVQVYADMNGVRCSFNSPTQGQYAVVGMSNLCIRVEVEQGTVWTQVRLWPVLNVLQAFGLSQDDSLDVMLKACPSCGHVIDQIKNNTKS